MRARHLFETSLGSPLFNARRLLAPVYIGLVLALVMLAAAPAGAAPGAHVVLDVDLKVVSRDALAILAGDIDRKLDLHHIEYVQDGADGAKLSLTVMRADRTAEAQRIVAGIFAKDATPRFVLTQPAPQRFVLTLADDYRRTSEDRLIAQSLAVMRRRVAVLGAARVERLGTDRMQVEIPGYVDLTALRQHLLATGPALTFRRVDEESARADLGPGQLPQGVTMLPYADDLAGAEAPRPLPVYDVVAMSGERIANAAFSFDDRIGIPVVELRFDPQGARQFAEFTRANFMNRIALVLDDRIVSAPVIYEPILGGTCVISGTFTAEQGADLVARLQAASSAPPFHIVEANIVDMEK